MAIYQESLLARYDILSYVVAVINEIFGASRKITDVRYIVAESQRRTCCHAAKKESMCRFQTKSFCMGNTRTAFRTANLGGTCAVS